MEELNGYVLINNKRYPFAFTDDKLKIYPIVENGDIAIKDKEYDELVPEVLVRKYERGNIIDEIELRGTLTNGHDVIFKVYDNPNDIDGFCTYTVISSYIYISEQRIPIWNEEEKRIVESKRVKNKIDGIIISGREIDFFFEPSKVFEHRYELENGKLPFTEFNITATQNKDEKCGSFVMGEIECEILIRSIVSVKIASKVPFSSYSELVLDFSKDITLEQGEKVIVSLRNCFQYLCRRKNIEFSMIEMFCNTENGKRRRFGDYRLNWQRNIEEVDPGANSQIINYEILKTNLGQLVQAFVAEEIYLNHLPDNKSEDRMFGPDRMIFDFVAFEREYQNLYPEKEIRSEEFIDAKKLVLDYINQLHKDVTGKRKKYVASIGKSVSRIENSLGERIQYAINDCKDIMTPFLIYNFQRKEYKNDVENMCDRLNQLRNDCAHGNMAIAIEGTMLTDYNTLECLLYAMRLKALGVSTLKAQKAIARVMNINMYIPEENIER